jgi:hypothetical protein
MKSEFCYGAHLDDDLAQRICKQMERACQIAKGDFSYRYNNGCTWFVAPRRMGSANHRIANAVLDGFRIGVFS